MKRNLNFKTMLLGLSLFISTSVFAAVNANDANSLKGVFHNIKNAVNSAVAKAEDLRYNKSQRTASASFAQDLLGAGNTGVLDYLSVLSVNQEYNVLIKFVAKNSDEEGMAIANTDVSGKRIALIPNTMTDRTIDTWACVTDFDADTSFASQKNNIGQESKAGFSTINQYSGDIVYFGNCERLSITDMDTLWNDATGKMGSVTGFEHTPAEGTSLK